MPIYCPNFVLGKLLKDINYYAFWLDVLKVNAGTLCLVVHLSIICLLNCMFHLQSLLTDFDEICCESYVNALLLINSL